MVSSLNQPLPLSSTAGEPAHADAHSSSVQSRFPPFSQASLASNQLAYVGRTLGKLTARPEVSMDAS